ncbi:hypothetical protein ACFPVY_14870 [Flavobacterium qiangtangense]|uniref:Uncharacterized protein n=1 Tax=Flavobacterium qiangtangense TaxID=1442595 RepID=A0ABW1PRA3_9FLAO
MLKNILLLIFSIIIILTFAVTTNLDRKAFEVIATFLSITTGFTITALSIIATSPFSKNLYEQESKKDNSKTILHELVDKFKISMKMFIVTICFIILLNLFNENYVAKSFIIFEHTITTIDLLKSMILYLTIVSLISFITLFDTFSKFVVKSGKSIK